MCRARPHLAESAVVKLFHKTEHRGPEPPAAAPRVAGTGRAQTVTLMGGEADLDVVGESYRQEDLWYIVGGHSDAYVRHPVTAVLVPEYDNEHDANAIAVHIDGLKVGYLPRDLAASYRAGLLGLEARTGGAIALSGLILGGGHRADGIGRLGVFLTHNPDDFGVEGPGTTSYHPPAPAVLTGAHEIAEHGRLAWRSNLPVDDVKAIRELRHLLGSETDDVERHYLFAELEHRLYRCRDVFPSALDDYDTACRDHDAEMNAVVPALIDELGGVPFLETYRQATVRHEHQKDMSSACWWAERGLSLYGDKALDPSWPADLEKRDQRCRLKAP